MVKLGWNGFHFDTRHCDIMVWLIVREGNELELLHVLQKEQKYQIFATYSV